MSNIMRELDLLNLYTFHILYTPNLLIDIRENFLKIHVGVIKNVEGI
jgi:hypothetical protein